MSTTPWVPMVLIALGSGVAGGLVGRITAPKPPPPPPVQQVDLSPLEHRVQRVEREVSALGRERAAERAAQQPQPSADPNAQNASPADPQFQAAVKSAVEQAEDARRDARDAKMVDRATSRLASRLGLNEDQKTKVAAIIDQLHKDQRALRDENPTGQIDDQIKDLHEKAETNLAQVLDAKQMAAYNALDDTEKLGGRRRARVGR